MTSPNIELLTAGTPNGQKISIFLEELGIPYKTTSIDLSKDEQKSSSFLKVNPNGRIPAIIDHTRNSYAVFESGAIMWYLVQKHDIEGTFWPKVIQFFCLLPQPFLATSFVASSLTPLNIIISHARLHKCKSQKHYKLKSSILS